MKKAPLLQASAFPSNLLTGREEDCKAYRWLLPTQLCCIAYSALNTSLIPTGFPCAFVCTWTTFNPTTHFHSLWSHRWRPHPLTSFTFHLPCKPTNSHWWRWAKKLQYVFSVCTCMCLLNGKILWVNTVHVFYVHHLCKDNCIEGDDKWAKCKRWKNSQLRWVWSLVH